MSELIVTVGNQRVTAQTGQIVRIGRSTTSDIVVDDPRVSREHLRLSWSPDGWMVECVGRAGTFIAGTAVTQFPVVRPIDVNLAEPTGPVVRFEPADVPAAAPAVAPAAAPEPVAPMATQAHLGAAPMVGMPQQFAPQQMVTGVGVPAGSGPAGVAGAMMPGGQGYGAAHPLMPGVGQPAPGGAAAGSGTTVVSALRMLIPIQAWVRNPSLREWQRLLVAVYALAPLVLLASLQNNLDLETLGWVYSLYIAPLWVVVFWYLIKPGRIELRDLAIVAVIVVAELVLIPAMTKPWEHQLAPGPNTHNLFAYIYGVGIAEELTKALPVAVCAIILLKVRLHKLDVRKWMFLGTISGLVFGVYEASTVYIPQAFFNVNTTVIADTILKYIANAQTRTTVHQISNLIAQSSAANAAAGIPAFIERMLVDGLQHAIWVGIAAFFIGLGTNYARRRVQLWILGLAIPSVLHGLNDWSLSGVFGTRLWPWILIQAFSIFLFLGYTVSAPTIEKSVRRTPLFRGQSMLLDPSRLNPSTQQPQT